MKLERRTLRIDYLYGQPGAYRLARNLVIDGEPYGLAIECTNPAYGDSILDFQERELLERIAANAKQEAA